MSDEYSGDSSGDVSPEDMFLASQHMTGYDTDGDGVYDAFTFVYDSDGDLMFDDEVSYFDADGDGKADYIFSDEYIDSDGDGIADTFVHIADTDGDGIFDVIGITDFDGDFDSGFSLDEAQMYEFESDDLHQSAEDFTGDFLSTFGNTVDNLAGALSNHQTVMVAINTDKLGCAKDDYIYTPGDFPDCAAEVIGIDTSVPDSTVIILHTPDRGNFSVSQEEFLDAWQDSDYRMMTGEAIP